MATRNQLHQGGRPITMCIRFYGNLVSQCLRGKHKYRQGKVKTESSGAGQMLDATV